MANKIQVRRGTKAKLPTLSSGEIGLCTDVGEVYIGNSGNLRINNEKTATRVVGNSSAGYKTGIVDYLVSGTSNAATAIQNALNSLPSSGGKIVFLEGTYSVSSAVTISKNVVFEGMGDGTQFNVSGSFATCSAAVNVVLRDMKITANSISTYLYKGGGSDTVTLENVTLDMTATGAHSDGGDTEAAFRNMKAFTAVNSRISAKATSSIHSSGTGCFAVVQLSSGTIQSGSVKIIGGSIKIDAQYGRIHIARYNMNVVGCELDLTSGSNSNDTAIIGGQGCHISGSFIKINKPAIVYGGDTAIHITGSRIYADISATWNAGNTSIIGCSLHNITANGTYSTGNIKY